MSKLIDLTGQKFGRLTVIERAENKGHEPTWICKCECGNLKRVIGAELRKGNTTSCGCYAKEVTSKRLKGKTPHNKRHGMTGTRIYKIWVEIKSRCNNPNDSSFKRYGGKGISVFKEWDNFDAFYDWSMSNGYAENLTIDRIDNNKGYSPDNCRWVTMKEQANNKTNNHIVVYKGKEYTISQLAEIYGVPYKKLWKRIKLNWSIEKALSTP
jgi:hypothetical protein